MKHLSVVALLVAVLTGCSKDDPPPGGTGPGTVTGLVMDSSTGAGISGATVSAGGRSTTTDGRGYFSLGGLDGGKVTLSINKTGFAPGFATPTLGDHGAPALVTLKREGSKQSYAPTTARTLSEVTEAGPYAVIFDASSLDTSSTNLTVTITPVDPSKESSVLPGQLLTSGSAILFPVTFAEFTILDSSNRRVQLKSGQSAIVELPIPPTMRGRYAIDDKIHCYAFNPETGAWDDFVDGTVRTSSVDGTTPVLAASIKHFSWYGAAPEGDDCISVWGNVVSAVDGKPLGNARVEATPGTATYTDANGNFNVTAAADGSAKYTAYQTGIDADGSLTGIQGAKYIEFGRVDEELVGLTRRSCTGASGALTQALEAQGTGPRGSEGNPLKITVGSIGQEIYNVHAVLIGSAAQVIIEAGIPDEDGGLLESHPASGVKMTLTSGATVSELDEIAVGSGIYMNTLLALEKGKTYQIAIDVDGNGSLEGQGTASIVGDLALTTPEQGGTYSSASFTPAWTDTGKVIGGASYVAIYLVTIQSTSPEITAIAYYTGTDSSFNVADLATTIIQVGSDVTIGGPLPAGEYTLTLSAFSGYAAAASGNFTQSNNITGVGLTGTAYSFGEIGAPISFTLE